LLISATRTALGAGWLRSRQFDVQFLLGIPAIACGSAALVLYDRRFFLPMLLVDLWLLSYQHVTAMLSRLPRAGGSARSQRFLTIEMPLITLATISGLTLGIGAWLPATLYLYWQWFHCAQQSWGVVQTYRRRADRSADLGDPALLTAAFYLVPAWGILHRSAQAPSYFIGLELQVMPVPWPMVHVVGIAACGAVALWAIERAIAWAEGRLPVAHTVYTASHFAIFFVAYRLIDDITVGWLIANIWHNAQYLSIAWLRHQWSRDTAADPRGRWLAKLAAGRQLGLYAIVALSSAAAATFGQRALALALPAAAFVYLTTDLQQYAIDLVVHRLRLRIRRSAAAAVSWRQTQISAEATLSAPLQEWTKRHQ